MEITSIIFLIPNHLVDPVLVVVGFKHQFVLQLSNNLPFLL